MTDFIYVLEALKTCHRIDFVKKRIEKYSQMAASDPCFNLSKCPRID